ncbi:MAG TPA: allantoate amidohydrolase [Thermoleophilaceae bacterium]
MIAPMGDAETVMERCDLLARCSEEPGRLTRRFATPALSEARDLVEGWMRDAGMATRRDPLGNLIGRLEGGGGRALALGSHIDTVPDAGRYDGPLGVLVGIACAERLRDARLPFALEVVAFADEEGARFRTAFLGSAVTAGRFGPEWLSRADDDGVTLADAIRAWGGDPDALAAGRRDDLLGYLEVHIEQGPVLDRLGIPLAIVTGIAGRTLASVVFEGSAGHAGTTPMDGRRDALAAAAEWIVDVEADARRRDGLVATVGELDTRPGAANVIAGRAVASLDVRHADDGAREAAVAALRERAAAAGAARGVEVTWEERQATSAVPCSPELTERLAAAAGADAPRLASGAGHDAAMIAAVAPVAMLFVRCRAGVSHHPDESVRTEDVAAAIDAATRFVERFEP